MPAPTFVNAGALAAVATGNVDPAVPASVLTDDVGLMAVMTNQGNTFPAITGWTKLGTARNSANQSTDWYWRRAASSGDLDPPAFTIASGSPVDTVNGLYGRVYAYRGCITTGTPFEGVGNNFNTSTDTNPLTSAVTTAGPDRLIVSLVIIDDDTSWTSGHPPAGWTNTGGIASTTVGGNCTSDAMRKERASAGTEAQVAFGVANATEFWTSLSLALIPPPPAAALPILVAPQRLVR